MVNLGQKKIMGALGIGENGTNTGPQRKIQQIPKYETIPQQIRPTTPNRPIKVIEDQFGISRKQ